MNRNDPRAVAARILKDILLEKASLATLLPKYCKHLPTQDASFVRELCYGCCRFQPLLDACLKQLLHKPLRNKDKDIYALLLIGCYQLSYLRTPDHAAISATVSACQALQKVWAKKMVNGILREYQRRSTQLLEASAWWQQAAHPRWLAEQLQQAWPDNFQQLLEANNQHPPFCLRVNTQHHTRDQYRQLLTAQQKSSTLCSHSSAGLVLEKAEDVSTLPGFDDGWVSVQDEAAQLAACILEPQPGEQILDACAAPGGKTAHLLERQTACHLTALDCDQARCDLIDENLHRLKLSARVICADATDCKSWWNRIAFDAILLDAPCSATGVIRRNPDIKLLRKADDIARLVIQQENLLAALWPLLKPGGRMLYATCSVLPQENEELISRFISQTEDASHQPLNVSWGVERTFGRQLFPQNQGHDGFYYAYLKKQN